MGLEIEMVLIENILCCFKISICLKFKFEKRSIRRLVYLSVVFIFWKCCYISSVLRNDR